MTEESIHFEFQEDPSHDNERILIEGLNENSKSKKKMPKIRTLGVFIKDPQEKVVGGVTGSTYYGALYIDLLWVKEEFRQQGLGAKLVHEAEKIAKERKCTFATVNTMDWEALTFYQSLDYQIEFIRKGFEKDSTMFLLRKNLS